MTSFQKQFEERILERYPLISLMLRECLIVISESDDGWTFLNLMAPDGYIYEQLHSGAVYPKIQLMAEEILGRGITLTYSKRERHQSTYVH